MPTSAQQVTQAHTVVDRLRLLAERDSVLSKGLDGGFLRASGYSVSPSGADRVACAIAHAVVTKPESAVGIAVPRGASPLPVLLGLFLALWRKAPADGHGRLLGSVAVSTKRTELRELARRLSFDGSLLEGAIGIARLVGVPIANEKRIRAAAMNLNTRERDFLDQQDSWLLFCLPNVAPPVAHNVIGAMVVDTAGSSETSWEQTWERNCAARRRQVWVGELGNAAFERFCSERGVPLVRLDWGLLAAAGEEWGVGTSALATTALSRRALDLPPIGARVIRHAEAEAWLMELQTLLHEMAARARSNEAPEVVGIAWRTLALLSRAAYPLGFYEAAAARMAFSDTVESLIERVEYVTATPFRGRWKPAFHTYWPGVKGSLQQLSRLLTDADENPKWWALQGRLETALSNNERVRILVQTRAERIGLKEALYADDAMLDPMALELFVEVGSFSQQRAWQGTPGDVTTLLLAPPPQRFADVYLAGEAGLVEVLCYPFELPRLRQRVNQSWTQYTDPAANHAALDKLNLSRRPAGHIDTVATGELVVDLPGFEERKPFTLPEDEHLVTPPDPDDDFWARAPDLHGTELPDEPQERDELNETVGTSARSVLIAFVDAPSIYFREDAEVTIVGVDDAGQPEVGTVAAVRLEAGVHIAVLPGSERGSLLSELMAAWDEGLALVRQRYLPMYQRALAAAEAQYGVAGLSAKIGLTEGAIRSWLRGWNRPLQPAHLRRLLEASGDEQAIANQAIIHDYFSKTRGTHRLIGRVLNEAVEETVLHGAAGGESLHKLKELVGVDLTDLFENVFVLCVATVSEPRDGIPAGVCGSFLDAADPYLHDKGVS